MARMVMQLVGGHRFWAGLLGVADEGPGERGAERAEDDGYPGIAAIAAVDIGA